MILSLEIKGRFLRFLKMKRWFLLSICLVFSLTGCSKTVDLVPVNFQSPPGSHPGGVVGPDISLEVKNTGSASAVSADGYFFVGFYISTDAALDNSDLLLVGGRESVNTPLAAGAQTPVSIASVMSIPSSVTPGNYYLLAVVDESGNKIQESNENNNVAANPITIGVSMPDLVPDNFTSPSSSNPGGTVGPGIALNAKNIGSASAVSADGYFFVGFYISTDAALDNSDLLLVGGRESVNTPLAAGALKPVSIASVMSIPTSITPGNYYLIALVDESGNKIQESNENNNVAANPITISSN
jgi:subtilase family serine protease